MTARHGDFRAFVETACVSCLIEIIGFRDKDSRFGEVYVDPHSCGDEFRRSLKGKFFHVRRALRAERDYEGLEMYILEHLMGK